MAAAVLTAEATYLSAPFSAIVSAQPERFSRFTRLLA